MKRARTDSSDEHSKSDKHFGSAFRDLESEVCDLDRMGEIADCLVMEWLETTGSSPPRQAELAVCAVQQLHRLLNEFKTQYYRAFEGDNEVAG
jgi:hypothetical protein